MSETTTTTQIVGRRDYGMGVEMAKVVIGGEEFLTLNGRYYRACHKCLNASGTINAYLGIDAGVCYACTGRGFTGKVYESAEQIEKAQKARAQREARRVAKIEAEAAEARAARDAWTAANPVIAERLAAVYTEVYAPFTGESQYDEAAYEASQKGEAKYGEFVLLMANYASYKALTENQTTAVVEALDKAEARIEAAAAKAAAARHLDAAVGAKVEVTGRVAVSMNVEGWSYGSTDRLVVVEGTGDFEGVTFKMTGNGKTLFSTERGDSVTIAATVKKFDEYKGTPQTILTRAKVTVAAE